MRRLWLLFAQTVTVVLALYFVYNAVRPDAASLPASIRQLGTGSARPATLLEASSNTPPSPGSYRVAASRAMPAVVNVLTTKSPKRKHPLSRDPFFRRFFERGDRGEGDDGDEDQSSLGSGVIVSPAGYILTNNHVVDAADDIQVVLPDGRKSKAKVVGTDPETDLAVIQIGLDKLPVIVLGHAENAKVGDVVLAIGNPFGVGQTVTMGIISALGRNNLRINNFENFIQTDAAINFGNSGGALIDTNGNLLGINSAIYSQTGGSVGIGFAIPVSTAKSVMEAIISSGHVTRGWIGVESQEITPELAESFGLQRTSGAIIAGVVRNGPADKAGIKPGDILVSVEGKDVHDTTEMLNLIAALQPGGKATMRVLRKSRETELAVTVGRRPVAK
ncbi:Do family serine endopeptidase [Pseudoduganella ginsengisoli]|uniref:Do family serine endopeptidase n=1 Tax=Pseudoduganella ginsengisoli TaxID=1462440 RepID=A0A6L6Q226_9BURK|nr:Do family serine endopeptidase [Pseudoduganella ginsengisoli]MTW03489.1 Do family serine endopeptidase [Pseudoduganella ginsengisoli]